MVKFLKRIKRKHTPSLGPPKSGIDKETIMKKVAEIPFWWHNIELGYGIVTPGHYWNGRFDILQLLLEKLDLSKDLSGKSVIDIGAWDGFFSFEAEKRGASRVLAIDNFYRMEKEGKFLDMGNKGFEIAKEILASKVQYKIMDVLDLTPETVGMFDITLCLGVIYHVKNPILALEKVASITNEMVIIESCFINKGGNIPLAQFIKTEFQGDPTVWWIPNRACLEAMVRRVGFQKVQSVEWKKGRIIVKGYKV
jgi:tRNA (mo5U34)-methyltransferase